VLRCGTGDKVEVGLLNGPKGTGRIETVHGRTLVLDCVFDEDTSDQRTAIDLICALPRPQVFKRVLETAGTMGVRNLYIINSKRVEKCYFSASVMDEAVIRKHLVMGLSQGRNTHLPQVSIHRRFKVFFNETLKTLEAREKHKARKLLPDPDAENYLAGGTGEFLPRVLLAIGPEGGWIPREVEMMVEKGFDRFRLGPWPLRVENAVVAAISQIQLAFNKDMRK
jgi:RsmE family RNA methyltransferase